MSLIPIFKPSKSANKASPSSRYPAIKSTIILSSDQDLAKTQWFRGFKYYKISIDIVEYNAHSVNNKIAMNMSADLSDSPEPENSEAWLDTVHQQVKSLRFGIVQIVIHDGRAVQIEKTEKIRLNPRDGQ